MRESWKTELYGQFVRMYLGCLEVQYELVFVIRANLSVENQLWAIISVMKSVLPERF